MSLVFYTMQRLHFFMLMGVHLFSKLTFVRYFVGGTERPQVLHSLGQRVKRQL